MMTRVKTKLLILVTLIAGGAVPQAHADLNRFMEVAPGIFRGDQPDQPRDYRRLLEEHGVRTLVNLRADDSVNAEREIAIQFGFRFENIPMTGLGYPEEQSVNQALSIVLDPAAQPVYVHCEHGKDRTGLIMALYRVLHEGWSREDAYREWKRLGFAPVLVNLSSYFYLHTPADPDLL